MMAPDEETEPLQVPTAIVERLRRFLAATEAAGSPQRDLDQLVAEVLATFANELERDLAHVYDTIEGR